MKDDEKKDIFSVQDVNDIGNGEPLFKDFAFEDWAMLQLRYELFLLQAAFKKDANDDERPGVTEQHFLFYFNRYYKKTLTPKHFGAETLDAVIKMVKDCVELQDG